MGVLPLKLSLSPPPSSKSSWIGTGVRGRVFGVDVGARLDVTVGVCVMPGEGDASGEGVASSHGAGVLVGAWVFAGAGVTVLVGLGVKEGVGVLAAVLVFSKVTRPLLDAMI
jgi:hypothetical protein